jgi:K+-sensing histidine kinase KdpD
LIALTHWEHTKPMITKVFLSSIVNDCLWSIPNDNALETTSIIDASYSVWTDRAMAISIISNLIGNAYKYVPVWWKVIVAVTVADNFYILTIADTWPWIDTADRIKIFQKFRKKNTNSEWFGLGLYLVDCLCKKLWWIIALDETYVSWTKRILNIPKK